MRGVVISGTNNTFAVECEDGLLRNCVIKGKKLDLGQKFYNPLAPGDEVTLDATEDSSGRILSPVERKNFLVRKNTKSPYPQIIAANLDCVVCVTAVDLPPFRPRFAERVLIQSEFLHIPVAVFVNKSDLPMSDSCRERIDTWRKNGIPLFEISVTTGMGLDEAKKFITGKTVALVGQSGVGKSSLLNYFCGNSLQRVGDVSDKKFRGTHTTTCGKLFHWAEGNLIDTPGVRSFLLWGIEAADLPYYYNEIGEKAQSCLFGHSCTHVSEKGCSVLAALEKGEITSERYESFLRIREELITGRITE